MTDDPEHSDDPQRDGEYNDPELAINRVYTRRGDEGLTSAAANTAVQSHVTVSIRPPDAFARLFDPASLYESVHDEPYPGPDRDPRS